MSELVGLRRSKVDVHRRKVRVTEQLIRLGSSREKGVKFIAARPTRTSVRAACRVTLKRETMEHGADVRPKMIVRPGPVVDAFDAAGWGWGGEWRSVKGYHHFSAGGR